MNFNVVEACDKKIVPSEKRHSRAQLTGHFEQFSFYPRRDMYNTHDTNCTAVHNLARKKYQLQSQDKKKELFNYEKGDIFI